MKCPKCGLENPPDGLRCDCGYDFPSGTVRESFVAAAAAAAAAAKKEQKSDSKKKPWVAFVLNYLLAGAGLAYMGMWRPAVMDFAVSAIIAVLIVIYAPAQLGLAAWLVPIANGVLAVVIAKSNYA
jgi:hypothetical protein